MCNRTIPVLDSLRVTSCKFLYTDTTLTIYRFRHNLCWHEFCVQYNNDVNLMYTK